jgi:eukaryotic-like serine/threonine-protein kinase
VPAKPHELTVALLEAEPDDRDVLRPAAREERPFSGPMPVSRREYARRLAAAGLGGIVLALVAVFAFDALTTDDPAEDSGLQPQVWDVESVTVYDPLDPEGGDNPDLAALTSDNDPQTSWVTEAYEERDFDGERDGIGLVFDLGEPRQVRGVDLNLVRGGLDLELYAVSELPVEATGPSAWGETRYLQTNTIQSPQFRFNATEERYWLVWVTGLSTSSSGEYTAEIAEVTFLGPS